MTSLEIKTIFKGFTTVELFYITTNYNDGKECIWKKVTEIKNGQERELQHSFYIGSEFHPELQTSEEIHQYLVDFLHKIEEKQKEDVDPDDNFETIFTFTDDTDPEDPEPETFAVWEGHMEDLKKKVTRIQNKCRKYGCDFSFKEVGEEIREVPSNETDPITKKPVMVKCRFILVQAEGTAVINGWEFVASVEHTSAGNIFSKALTTVQIPARYRNTDCICEHCKTKRIRKNTSIIRNTETGEFRQIGDSCLKDYTHGMSASMATWYASLKTIFKDAEEESIPVGSMGWWQRYFDTKEFLQYTAETIRHFGYSKSEGADSTKNRVQEFFNVRHGMTRYWETKEVTRVKELMEEVGFDPESPEAVKMTEDALAWIADQEATNDYIHNLKVATSLKDTTSARFGLLVSLFPTYNRELEYQAKKKTEAEAGKQSKHIGQIGDRVDVQVASVKCLTSWSSCFDGYHETTTFIWKITDMEGNVFTWKTSKWLNEEVPPVSIKGTVKEHKEFRGVLQTELTRCKVTAKKSA